MKYTTDHGALKLLSAVARRCNPSLPEDHSSFEEELETCEELFTNLKSFIGIGVKLILEIIFRIGRRGFLSIDRQSGMKSNLRKITKKLLLFNSLLLGENRDSLGFKQRITGYYYRLNGMISKSYPYQMEPSFSELSAPLWTKLNSLPTSSLLNKLKNENCCICFEDFSAAEAVILDNCSHHVCRDCALKTYNLPDNNFR